MQMVHSRRRGRESRREVEVTWAFVFPFELNLGDAAHCVGFMEIIWD